LREEEFRDVSNAFSNVLRLRSENHSAKWSGRWDSNRQPPAWELESPLLYFHNLQNGLGKINVHAAHTMHAVPDLRIGAGRLRDGFLRKFHFLGNRLVRSLRAKCDGSTALARNCETSEAESCQPVIARDECIVRLCR
jgi:hypothetical protein